MGAAAECACAAWRRLSSYASFALEEMREIVSFECGDPYDGCDLDAAPPDDARICAVHGLCVHALTRFRVRSTIADRVDPLRQLRDRMRQRTDVLSAGCILLVQSFARMYGECHHLPADDAHAVAEAYFVAACLSRVECKALIASSRQVEYDLTARIRDAEIDVETAASNDAHAAHYFVAASCCLDETLIRVRRQTNHECGDGGRRQKEQ